MMLIKGEHFNTGSNLFDHVKIPSDTLVAVLSGLYEKYFDLYREERRIECKI